MCFRRKKKEKTFQDWNNSVDNFGFNDRAGKLAGDFEGYGKPKEQEELTLPQNENVENLKTDSVNEVSQIAQQVEVSQNLDQQMTADAQSTNDKPQNVENKNV